MSYADLEVEDEGRWHVVDTAGFKFVQGLAADLNRGDIKLPSFPDVVMRIRRAIDERDCGTEKLARIVATEPALAGRLLAISNSALMKRGTRPVSDLKTAINRLGHEMLHATAVSVAIEQIMIGASLKQHRARLRSIWRDAARVAAIALTVARQLRSINPDEALMAGLLHNVGKLYILMNSEAFLDDEDVLESVLEHWHGQVGRAIVEGWGFTEDKAAAVAEHMDFERNASGPPDLTDIVCIAWLLSRDDEQLDITTIRSFNRLQLDETKLERIVRESADDIDALAQALNG